MGDADARGKRLAAAALLAAALVAGAAGARAETTRLADRAPFAEGSGATAAVREQCGLEAALPELLRAAARDVELAPGQPAGRRTLALQIAEVHAPGGGPFAGPKWMTVDATLRANGKTIATARAHRVTADPFGGTCAQLRKVARAIASDLAAWLAAPTSGAALGDVR